MNKIVVFGAGYVGFSLSVVLATKFEVILFEVDDEKITNINNSVSPIKDDLVNQYLPNSVDSGRLRAMQYCKNELLTADLIIMALPTDFSENLGKFSTEHLDKELKKISEISTSVSIVIKSTVPIGYTDYISKKLHLNSCFYSPEFLREGSAIHDNLHPSRIIIGSSGTEAKNFASMLGSVSIKTSIKTIFTDNKSAELIKLSSNSFLAARVAFFNEIDTYALKQGLNAEEVIAGVCLDPRIGEGYSNPSFSYGGYCLPKDVRQLQSSLKDSGVKSPFVDSIHKSNETRLNYIISEIKNKDLNTIGIYRVQMKQGSDNYREASNYRILKYFLEQTSMNVVLYEPEIKLPPKYEKLKTNFNEFARISDLIIANRISSKLKSHEKKVFSRDIYNEN